MGLILPHNELHCLIFNYCMLLPYYIYLYLYNGQHNGDCYPRSLEDLDVDDGKMC
jgi:hypothetical protein